MNFLIRDDDLNYFSTPKDIEKWYSDIFDLNIPVNFATVPLVKPLSDVYPKNLTPENKEYSIGLNGELVSYLKNNSLIEIMQHGCNHETRGGVFEYSRKQGLISQTLRGKEELEKVFDRKVKVFVAPHDRISNHGLKAIEKAGLDIIKAKGCKNFIFSLRGLKNYGRMISHRLKFLSQKRFPAYPYVLDFGGHKQAYSYRLRGDNLEELKKGLGYSIKKKGNFIITAHLHNFNQKRKEDLLELIKLAQEEEARFIFASELFQG